MHDLHSALLSRNHLFRSRKRPVRRLRFGIALLAVVAALLAMVAGPAHAKVTAGIPKRADGLVHVDLVKWRGSVLWTPLEKALLSELGTTKVPELSEALKAAARSRDDKAGHNLIAAALYKAKSITAWMGGNDEVAVYLEIPGAGAFLPLIASDPKSKPKSSRGVSYYALDDAFVSSYKDMIVVAEKSTAVVDSVLALRGKGKRLSKSAHAQLTTSRQNGIILVAGLGGRLMDELRKEASSAVMSSTIESVVVVIGDNAGKIFVSAKATMAKTSEAKSLAQVGNGFVALANLSDDDKLKKAAQFLTINSSGKRVEATLELPTKVFLDLTANP